MGKKKVFGVKEIVTLAALLAICIVSQYFKNLSIFITGPIINACIILAVLAVNLPCAILLSIITPVTAYFIAATPVMTNVPLVIPFIMAGNAVLAISTHVLLKKDLAFGKGLRDIKSWIKAVICAALMNGGAYKGKRILGELTVKAMTRVPDEVKSLGRSLGWDNYSDYSSNVGNLFTPYVSYGHTGYTGPSIAIDPVEKVALIILTNRCHPYDTGGLVRQRALIANIVAGAVTGPIKSCTNK